MSRPPSSRQTTTNNALVRPRPPDLNQLASAKPGALQLYEIVGVNVDPYTGVLARPFVLPDGGLRVATFSASGSTLAFSDVDPTEGAENFTAVVVGMTSGNVAITTPVAAASAVTTNVFLNDLTP